MSVGIFVNTLVEYLPRSEKDQSTFERVLWLDPAGDEAFVIPCKFREPLPDPKEDDANGDAKGGAKEPEPLPVLRKVADIQDAIQAQEAIKRPVDPFLRDLSPDSEFLKKHAPAGDKAWELIKDLVVKEPEIYMEKGRGRLVHGTAKEHGVHPKTIYRLLRKFWIGGKKKNAVLPDYDLSGGPGVKRIGRELDPKKKRTRKETGIAKRGRPSRLAKGDPEKAGVNVTPDDETIFQLAMDTLYDKDAENPVERVYKLMIDNYYNKGYRIENGDKVPIIPDASEIPTRGQFKYYLYQNRDLKKSLIARKGQRAFNLKHRAVLGSSTQMAHGPGSLYQIDSTVADVYLVNNLKPSEVIGRPVLYVVVDVFSRLIAGFYAGLEGPSYAGAMMALANTGADKVAYCAEHGIKISEAQWPCRYLPESILSDRGPEFIGKNSDNLVANLDIRVSNTPPYRADWKGIVEQTFRLINNLTIDWDPGHVKKGASERGARDPRLDAKLTLEQFERKMIYTILRNNVRHLADYPLDASMIREDVSRRPVDLWDWGIKNRSGHLRERTEREVILGLLPRGTAMVTHRGVRFEGMYYTCDRAIREQWFEKARAGGRHSIPICYDHRRVDTLFMLLEDGKKVEPLRLLRDLDLYKGRRLEEVIHLNTLLKAEDAKSVSEQLQEDAALEAHSNAIDKEAEEVAKTVGTARSSKRAKIKNTKKNHTLKKAENQRREAFDPTTSSGRSSGSSGMAAKGADVTRLPKPTETALTAGRSRRDQDLELLRARRQKEEKDGE